VVIPFEGDPKLWRVQASTYSMSGYPEIEIRDGAVAFAVQFTDDTAKPQSIRQIIDRDTRSLAEVINSLKRDVEQHNQNAPGEIRRALQFKRKQAESTVGVLADLGIPIKQKGEPPAFVLPVQRRQQPIRRPAVAAGNYVPEPFLDEKEYE
jgi:hypothetical protein